MVLSWLVAAALLLLLAVRGTRRATFEEEEGEEEEANETGVVVVVMPSPPMVSGPMTRMDRLQAIRDTWGSDLVGAVGDDTDVNRCDLSSIVTHCTRTCGCSQ